VRNKENAKIFRGRKHRLAVNSVDKDPVVPRPSKHLPALRILSGGWFRIFGDRTVQLGQCLHHASKRRKIR
jgi:hypothetical protein